MEEENSYDSGLMVAAMGLFLPILAFDCTLYYQMNRSGFAKAYNEAVARNCDTKDKELIFKQDILKDISRSRNLERIVKMLETK